MTFTAADASQLFREPPERFIETGGGAVAYRRVGSGPDVIFSHGWPASGATWRTVLPLLAPHVTCHIVDHLGAGASRFDRSTNVSLDGHIQALRDVVDELELETFAVVGHDSGAMIARHAFAGDERVRGWGLVATEQPPKPNWRFSSFLLIRYIPKFEKLLGTVFGMPRLRRNKFIGGDVFHDRDLLAGEFDEFYLSPLASSAERQWAAGHFFRTFDMAMFSGLAECHRKMTGPVAMVWGEKDPFFPVSSARAVLDDFAGGATLEVIPDGKLFVHEEFPEPTARALLTTIS
ncbi:MAG: alpha/beta hydrolase [Actinomycetota bacterium]